MPSPLLPSSGPGPGRVYGLDNVALDLPVAGVGSRVLAGFLDYLIVGITGVLWFVVAALSSAAVSSALGAKSGWALLALGLLGFFAIEYGYFAGFEIATGGRTLGKKAVGLTVVTLSGARPTWGSLLARNLVRTIDVFVGVPLMALDARARRLGDRIGGTLVVYLDPRGPGTFDGVARVPQGWGPAEIAVLESFLAREAELDRPAALAVAERLVAAIRRDDPSFLSGADDHADPISILKSTTAASRE